MGALEGIKIIEFAGIGPAPFACMMLADMGADVVRIERPDAGGTAKLYEMGKNDILARNRTVIHLDIKSGDDKEVIRQLIKEADGLIEGFRPGVMEKVGLGPDDCLALNPKLVFGRMTGWGQSGDMAHSAGHDINYIAMNGVLDMIGNAGEKPACPPTLVGDMGGGAMFLVSGILAGLLSAGRTGKGQVVDAAVVDGSALLGAVPWSLEGMMGWGPRGTNMVDGGPHFYDTYECSDGKYLSVGALEPQFYMNMLAGFGLQGDPTFQVQFDKAAWPNLKIKLAAIIAEKTRDEWASIFAGVDACVAPVLTRAEAVEGQLNDDRDIYPEIDGVRQPAPAPRFSQTPSDIRHLRGKSSQPAATIVKRWTSANT